MCQASLEDAVKNEIFRDIMDGCSPYFKLIAGAVRDPLGLNRYRHGQPKITMFVRNSAMVVQVCNDFYFVP